MDLSARMKPVLAAAVAEGADAVVVYAARGQVLGFAGDLSDEDIVSLTGVIKRGVRGAGLTGKLLAGEPHLFPMDTRLVGLAIARKQLFLAVVVQAEARALVPSILEVTRAAANRVLNSMARGVAPPDPPPDGGSGPAELETSDLVWSPDSN